MSEPNLRLRPLSTEPAALEATARTIEAMVPGSHVVHRHPNGVPILEEYELLVSSTDPDFIIWAAPRQGYVASARRETHARGFRTR